MRRAILGLAFFLLLAAPARAGIVQDFSDFASATNGIVMAPDGNFWVAEENSSSVARITPGGQLIQRYTVGANPTSIALGNGVVWVTVTGVDKLARFDATSGAQLPDFLTNGQSNCGPVAIADGGNGRMYLSLPQPGGNPSPCPGFQSRMASVSYTTNDLTAVAMGGAVYDIAVSAGSVLATEPENDLVRRWSLALQPGATTAVSNGPDGIVVDGSGFAWVTKYNGGGVARFPVSGGAATDFPPTGGTLTESFGIVAGKDGNVWVTGKASKNIARISPTGTYKFFSVGSEPWEIVNGANGDFYFTDRATTRVRRLINAAPKATTGAAAGVSTTAASVSASVDSGGNPTTVLFDYGPTAAYGATAQIDIPAAVGATPVSTVLTGLTAGTTYHVRVRATNEEGAATGADATFATTANPPPPPPPPDVLAARANFSWGFKGSRTALTKVTVTDLRGGETIKVTCKSKSKGCKFSSKTYKNVKKPKKGTKSLTSLFGRKRLLKTGAKIVVTVTAPGAVGSSATATIGKRKRDPKIVRKRINP